MKDDEFSDEALEKLQEALSKIEPPPKGAGLAETVVHYVSSELRDFAEGTVLDFIDQDKPKNFREYLIDEIREALPEMAIFNADLVTEGKMLDPKTILEIQEGIEKGVKAGFIIPDEDAPKVVNTDPNQSLRDRIASLLTPQVRDTLLDATMSLGAEQPVAPDVLKSRKFDELTNGAKTDAREEKRVKGNLH